jgi:hypothetical protein
LDHTFFHSHAQRYDSISTVPRMIITSLTWYHVNITISDKCSRFVRFKHDLDPRILPKKIQIWSLLIRVQIQFCAKIYQRATKPTDPADFFVSLHFASLFHLWIWCRYYAKRSETSPLLRYFASPNLATFSHLFASSKYIGTGEHKRQH